MEHLYFEYEFASFYCLSHSEMTKTIFFIMIIHDEMAYFNLFVIMGPDSRLLRSFFCRHELLKNMQKNLHGTCRNWFPWVWAS